MGRVKARPRRQAAEAAKDKTRRIACVNRILEEYIKKLQKSSKSAKKKHHYTHVEPNGIFGVDAQQGVPDYMEDFHDSKIDGDAFTVFGVFDGHGGHVCGEYLKNEMLNTIYQNALSHDNIEKSLTSSFSILDRDFCEVGDENDLADGATCTVALIKRTPGDEGIELWVANVGDSRCILVPKSGETEVLTRDHNCDLKDECDRIKRGGGKVIDVDGILRVQGEIAITRSIGDRVYKPHLIAIPEVTHRKLDIDNGNFLCIASDGVWDVISNDEVADLIREHGIANAASRITSLALERDSDDNITCMVIDIAKTLLNTI